MNLHRIESVNDLKEYLSCALQLEHATIPPYLTALYSIREGTNADAVRVIRVVAIEEMLHMTLVANMLNAIGGKPDLLAEDFVPIYPAYLPDGETEFKVSIEKFSLEALETFLQIEMPRSEKSGNKSEEQLAGCRLSPLKVCRLSFKTIGDFYAEIRRGFDMLAGKMSRRELFCGAPGRQVKPEHWWGGGGEVVEIRGIEDLDRAIDLIAEQGEGYDGNIFDEKNELAHYYRFQQLKYGRYYEPGNEPDKPQGEPLAVDFGAVYPIKKDAALGDYSANKGLYSGAIEFAGAYRKLLVQLNDAFNGNPNVLRSAVPLMSQLKNAAKEIIRIPIPGDSGLHAAPIFVLPPSKEKQT